MGLVTARRLHELHRWCDHFILMIPTNQSLLFLLYYVGRCVAYGVLEDDEAAKLFKIITKRKKSGKSSGSTPTPVKKKSSAGGSKKKAKIIGDVGYDAGMQSGGAEGIGAAAL